MASGGNIGPKIGIDGEKEFKQEIKSINTSLKTMGAEMDAVTSAFIGNEDSAEALTAKNKVLQAQMGELTKKAEAQRARLAELDAAGVDPTSEAYQKLLADLYKTEAQMNKTEAEIKQNTGAIDKMGSETEDTTDAVKDETEAMKKGEAGAKTFGDVLKANLASEAIIAGVKALAAALKAVGKAVLDAAAAADDLQTLSVQTGISTDELQKFQYAAEAIDVDVDTLTGSMSKLTKNMASAASGTGATAEAFAQLGVEVTDGNGELRDRNEVFQEAIKALGEMSNETERDAVAMKIFGKSAQELNPLIEGGADALAELGAHAEAAGLIMSEDALSSLSGLNDAFGIFKSTLSMAGQSILAKFAGPLTDAMETVTGYVERLVRAFQEGGLAGVGDALGEIISNVTHNLTNLLPELTEFAMNAILALTEGLISQLPTIVKSATEIIMTLVDSLASALPDLIPVAVDAILTIADTLTDPEMLGQLVDGAIAIITALANGLIKALPRLLDKATEIIDDLVTAIIDNVPKLIDGAIPLVVALANGLIEALPKLLEKAPEIIARLVAAIVENVPKLVEAAFGIVGQLVMGIVEYLPLIGETAGEIITTLLSGLAELGKKMIEIGENVVKGIWEGIKNMGDWLWQQVSGFFSGIIDGVKGFLGIHSPSTVFAGIGSNMAAGIGVGFDKTMQSVERDMMSSLSLPTVNVGGVSAAGTAGNLDGQTVEEITIPVEVGGVELARVLYRHIVGEGQRIGAAAVS